MRLAFAHPSRQRLLAWLDGTDENEGITEHVDQCDRCASRIEELAGEATSHEPAASPDIGAALRAAYAPPEDINDRVMEKIKQRRLADRDIGVLFGLFSIPKDAVQLMLPSETDDDTSRDDRDDWEERT